MKDNSTAPVAHIRNSGFVCDGERRQPRCPLAHPKTATATTETMGSGETLNRSRQTAGADAVPRKSSQPMEARTIEKAALF